MLKFKIPVVIPPPPAFDYIIDIYSDKVVITASDGSKTTLGTIANLNSWLRNVRGKKIRINVHAVITGVENSLELSSNEYWIFGEWVRTYVDIYEPNTTVISFAPLGDYYNDYYVENWSPVAQDYVDISGLKLFAVYADIDFEAPYSPPPSGYMTMSVAVLNANAIKIYKAQCDLFARGGFIGLYSCKLGNTYIDGLVVTLNNCVADSKQVALITRLWASLINTDLSGVTSFYADLRFVFQVDVPAGGSGSVTIYMPKPGYMYRLYIEQVGVFNQYAAGLDNLIYLTPLPSGVSYSIDAPNKKIVISNSTSSSVTVVVVYRIQTLP